MLRTTCRGLLVLIAILAASCTQRATPTEPSFRRTPMAPVADGNGDTLCFSGYPITNGNHC